MQTQIYLTTEQRRRLDEIRKRGRKSVAEVIGEAIDAYLGDPDYLGDPEADVDEIPRESFGSMPDLKVPSRDEWDRGNT